MSSTKSFRRELTPTKIQPSLSKTTLTNLKTRSISGSRQEDKPKPIQLQFKSVKFDLQMQSVAKDLKNNKSKLCSCMEIYSMLQSTNQTQRCLQHNNTLSLYCLSQRRILCVNCLYGMHKHRSHKVIPLKDSMSQVYEDNKKLTLIIEQEIKKIDYYAKMSQQNKIIIESEMQRVILQIEIDYAKKVAELKDKYDRSKKLVLESFNPVIEKCKLVQSSLQDFRFNIWKAHTLYSDQKSTDENQVMKQLLFVTIVELCQFRNRSINKTELDALSRRARVHF